jgi:hypothetical protein
LKKYDVKTEVLSTLIPSGLCGPCGICCDAFGTIYVAEYSGNEIRMVVNEELFRDVGLQGETTKNLTPKK